MPFYKKNMHFNDIFEKNIMTVTWLLFTVSHAGLIYLHNCTLKGGGFGFGMKK